MKNVIGISMIVILFIGVFVFISITSSTSMALAVFGQMAIMLAVVAWAGSAAYLLAAGKKKNTYVKVSHKVGDTLCIDGKEFVITGIFDDKPFEGVFTGQRCG